MRGPVTSPEAMRLRIATVLGRRGASIDNRREAVARKYIGELRGQFFGWLRRGIDPFLLGEMYVAILKGGGNHCALAIDLLRVGRNGQCARLADHCDLFRHGLQRCHWRSADRWETYR